MAGKIPTLKPAIKALPTAAEVASELAESRSMLYAGTDSQRAARIAVAHDAYRLREELKRGAESVDLQDVESVKARVLEYVAGCEQAARVPLWGGLCSRGFGLSRQFLAKWMSGHQGHDTAKYLQSVREAFADALASAAITGSVSPVPAIFALKAQAGWRDSGADEDAVEIDEGEASFDMRQILARYGLQSAAESASGALDDAEDV